MRKSLLSLSLWSLASAGGFLLSSALSGIPSLPSGLTVSFLVALLAATMAATEIVVLMSFVWPAGDGLLSEGSCWGASSVWWAVWRS
ncbi:MAG: hypothetical protein IT210_04555 [Armatimonadetes bacterium]|nr:hypothetical protein [Armatimonadota bacterium]